MTNYSGNAKTINSELVSWKSSNKQSSASKALNLSTASLYLSTGSSTTTYYYMRALDSDCLPTITYRYWTVTGTPDTTGSLYVGTRCGVTPLSNIVVLGKFTV